MAVVLVDTNVLVYAHDRGEFDKQRQAIQVLHVLHASGQGRLSAQVLAEFIRAATKTAQPMLTIDQARRQAEYFVQAWPIVDLTPMIVLEAARGVRDHQLSYYDAQIWATARLNQIPIVFSEDFSSGATLEGVHFVNPFAPEFALEAWT